MERISNSKRYRAIIRNILPPPLVGEDVEVVSTCNHPSSSYGLQVWVDRNGYCYGQINLPLMGWDILELEEISESEAAEWES